MLSTSGVAATTVRQAAGVRQRTSQFIQPPLRLLLPSLAGDHGGGFFTDAPIAIFPVSWQDAGRGVFALAVSALLLGFGPQAAEPERRVALAA